MKNYKYIIQYWAIKDGEEYESRPGWTDRKDLGTFETEDEAFRKIFELACGIINSVSVRQSEHKIETHLENGIADVYIDNNVYSWTTKVIPAE